MSWVSTGVEGFDSLIEGGGMEEFVVDGVVDLTLSLEVGMERRVLHRGVLEPKIVRWKR